MHRFRFRFIAGLCALGSALVGQGAPVSVASDSATKTSRQLLKAAERGEWKSVVSLFSPVTRRVIQANLLRIAHDARNEGLEEKALELLGEHSMAELEARKPQALVENWLARLAARNPDAPVALLHPDLRSLQQFSDEWPGLPDEVRKQAAGLKRNKAAYRMLTGYGDAAPGEIRVSPSGAGSPSVEWMSDLDLLAGIFCDELFPPTPEYRVPPAPHVPYDTPARIETDGAPAVRDGDLPPVLLWMNLAEYPELARKQRASGNIIPSVVIERTGRVGPIRPLETHLLLEPITKKEVARWLFRPAVRDGETIRVSEVLVANYTSK